MTASDIIDALRALANNKNPGLDISDLLYRHRCFYLLAQIGDARYKQRLIMVQTLNRIAVKERYKICRPLFEKINFPYVVIKGATLSGAAYGDPFVRSSGDIDLLIRRQNADAMKELLLSEGFIQGRVTDQGIAPFTRSEILFQTAMSHQTAPYIKQTSNPLCPYVNVDVNMDILWGECEEKSNMDWVLYHSEESSLFDIPFRKLTREMEFIALCLHHYKDMNSLYLLMNESLHLNLFCDLYYYLRTVHLSVETLKGICQSLNVGRYVYVCIHHTHQIFNDPILLEYLNTLDSQKDPFLLNTLGLNEKERKEWGLSLEERLFHENLPGYISSLLSEEEGEKIKINRKYM